MQNPSRPVVVCIGGSDSAGMAGIAMDVRTVAAMGAHACSVVTATTAQNSHHFYATHPVDAAVLQSQLDAVRQLEIAAVKIGLIATEPQLQVIAEFVRAVNVPTVLDPVLASSTGKAFGTEPLDEALKTRLFPLCTLVTPNLAEAGQLLQTQPACQSAVQQRNAGEALLSLGCRAVLVKGGHGEGTISRDWFGAEDRHFWLNSSRQQVSNTRGTGCALASSIAAALALNYPLCDAVVIGKMAINQGLRQGYQAGGQQGPVWIDHFPNDQVDLPDLSQNDDIAPAPEPFPDCGETPLGLYPIVDRASWIERLLPLGITTLQLRIKDVHGDALEQEIRQAIALARKHHCRLFINDYWQLAIKHAAYGVHLGQEDLDTADIAAIREAGLRLGTSTHCHYEVARAHSCRPSYIAIGPVYPTTTKIMPWIPHGPEGFRFWRTALDYPLVAIGGINRERIPVLRKAGADSIAMITAITLADKPEQAALDFMRLMDARED